MSTAFNLIRWLVAASAAVVSIAAGASALPPLASDFDADGASDFAMVRIEDGGGLSWRSFGSTAELELGSLGRVGDHLIMGHWLSVSGPPQIGIVSPDSPTGKIVWSILDGATQVSRELGEESDLVVSGGDFDGNGIADGAVVTSTREGLVWTIQHDLFSSVATAPRKISFGEPGDTPFFFSPRGAGDWLAVVQPGPGNLRTIAFRNPKNGRTRRFRLRRSVSFEERPFPISLPTGRDVLAFVSRRGGNTNVMFKRSNGRTISRAILSGSGVVVGGDFSTGTAGEELAVQTDGGFSLFNPNTSQSSSVSAPDGIPVDEININSFSDGGSSPLPGECTELDPRDGNEGFLWKPNSDTQFFAVTVLPSVYTGRAKAVETRTTGGQTINELTGKGAGNGNRTAWQDFRLTGADYRRIYGSIVVHATMSNGECIEYTIDDPSRRVD